MGPIFISTAPPFPTDVLAGLLSLCTCNHSLLSWTVQSRCLVIQSLAYQFGYLDTLGECIEYVAKVKV